MDLNKKAYLSQYLQIIIPMIIIVGMFGFVKTELFKTNEIIFAKALVFDLLIGIPILYYLLQEKPNYKNLIKIFALCLFLSTLIIPENNIQILIYLNILIYPILKIWIAYKICQKLINLRKEYRKKSLELKGFELYITILRNTFKGKFGEILIMEFSVIYFLFKRINNSKYNNNEFSYTKNKGTAEMVYGFIFIIAIETIIAHILITKLNPIVAIVSTYSSIYLITLFISILKSRHYFPIKIEDNYLTLKYGYINKTEVKYEDIFSIEQSSKSNNSKLMKLSAFKGIESHNIIINFNKTQKIYKIFGIERKYKSIGFYVDEPNKFIKILYTKIKEMPDGNKL